MNEKHGVSGWINTFSSEKFQEFCRKAEMNP